MTDTKNHTAAATGSIEGKVFRPTSAQDTAEAVELAFNYRGDVTLSLTSGELIVGYLFNRLAADRDSYIEIFPADQPGMRRIPYDAIATIAFTGEDTANGKSWEAWVAKKESDRRAEAERVEADARTRGHL